MNQYREALKAIAIGGLVIGALITVIAVLVFAGGGGTGSLLGLTIGSALFSLGIVGLFFWLHAESIAHGQRALIQAIQRGTLPAGGAGQVTGPTE